MHRDFRELLDGAKGYSEFVIALNLDIRDFTDWSLKVDPAQSVLFLKKVYGKLIDRYFSAASFVKPTGDGLFVVFDFEEDQLQEKADSVVSDAMEIVDTSGTLSMGESMINFDVPEQVGIGLARGSAAKLVSGDKTLDYSGRVLNLASRLMELARPRGLVIDSAFGHDLIPGKYRDSFRSEDVYLKGISPRDKMQVYCAPDELEIPKSNLQPFDEPKWETETHNTTLAEVRVSAKTPKLGFQLDATPLPDSLAVKAFHPQVESGRKASKRFRAWHPIEAYFELRHGQPYAVFDQAGLRKILEEAGVRRNWPIEIKFFYRLS